MNNLPITIAGKIQFLCAKSVANLQRSKCLPIFLRNVNLSESNKPPGTHYLGNLPTLAPRVVPAERPEVSQPDQSEADRQVSTFIRQMFNEYDPFRRSEQAV